MKLELNADKITIRGPNVDNGWKVTFDVGEYEFDKVAELVQMGQGNFKLVVEKYD